MTTLIQNLDKRVKQSPRFRAGTVAEYFRKTQMRWWKEKERHTPYLEQARTIELWIGKIKPQISLELGPGFGRITHLIQKSSPRKIELIEINERACQELREKFPNATITTADFTSAVWERDGQYDLIVAVEVLVHVPDIEDLISRIYKSLCPGGSTILSITTLEWYRSEGIKNSIIHRGIDTSEFEDLISKFFRVRDCHQSKNKQLRTYWLTKT